MTDEIESSGEQTEQLPEGQYLSFFKTRPVVMRHISPAQSMVLGGMLRKIRGGDLGTDGLLDMFGKMMALIENLIVNREDLTWLEDNILNGNLDIPDFASVFSSLPESSEKPAKRAPKRAR